jgi:hypothetical protein
VEEMLLTMVKKTMDQLVLSSLASKAIMSISFNSQMSYDIVDIFVLVINFLNDTEVPMHFTMGLFEVNETTEQSLVAQVRFLLKKFGMLHWVITFVKDEGTNLITMAIALHFIIDCEPLKKIKVYEGTSFRHVMFKAYQYATNDDKVFVRL